MKISKVPPMSAKMKMLLGIGLRGRSINYVIYDEISFVNSPDFERFQAHERQVEALYKVFALPDAQKNPGGEGSIVGRVHGVRL